MATTQIRGANNGTGTSQILAASISNADVHASAAIATTKLADSANFILRGGSVAFTANQDMGGFKLTGLGTPTLSTDAATKSYVDAAAAGIDWKASVRAATTVTGTLASAYANGSVIDGVTLATNDRILIKNQSTGSENGIYFVNAAGTPTRATDANTNAQVTPGMAVFVEEGTANADTGWLMTNDGAITLGTTSLVFIQFTSLGQITAGNGLSKSGSTLSIDTSITADLSTAQTFTNKTLTSPKLNENVVVTTTATKLNYLTSATGTTGTASTNIVFSTSPVLTTPTLGVASATSLATSAASPLLLTNGQLVTVALTSQSVGATTLTIPDFASVADEFTFKTKAQTMSNKTFIAPVLGAATATTINKVTLTAPTSAATLTLVDGSSLITAGAFALTLTSGQSTNVTIPTVASMTMARIDAAQTFTGVQTFSTPIAAGSVATMTATVGGGVPTPPNNTTTFLRGDGTFATPSGGGTLTPANFITRETPTGSVNSSNVTFTLANTPTAGTEQVYLNGILQEPGAGNDYTISSATITYLTAPLTGDRLRVSYMK